MHVSDQVHTKLSHESFCSWKPAVVSNCRTHVRNLCSTDEEKRAQSPSYKLWLEEQEKLELFRQEEEKRLHDEQNARWLQEEEKAREYWIKQQKRLERLRVERAKQEVRNGVLLSENIRGE